MKNKLVFLLLILSCSTTKYYKVPELQAELIKNAEQLKYIEQSVSSDFSRKLRLLKNFRSRSRKNHYLSEKLNWRIKEMKSKKSSLQEIGSRIKEANQELLTGIKDRNKISERDPIFEKIEIFGDKTTAEARELFQAFDEYRSSSASFTKIMLFSRSSLKRETTKNL